MRRFILYATSSYRKEIMQEKLVEVRPRGRAVSFEPTLKTQRYLLFFGIVVFVAYVITLVLFRQVNTVIFGVDSFFFLLWVYCFYPLFYLIYGKPWRRLEKKRQQVARYLLSKGLPMQQAWRQGCSDIPAQFALRFQRRWLGFWIVSITRGLELMVLVLFLSAFWRDTVSLLIHQQESLVLALLQTVLNVAVVFYALGATVVTLVFMPRQQVTAAQDGLFCRLGYHFSFIPWKQARLFAVIGEKETKKHGSVFFYELSSEKAVIRWSSQPTLTGLWHMPSTAVGVTGLLVQADCSGQEYERRVQTLLSIIAERTGLPLSDLR